MADRADTIARFAVSTTPFIIGLIGVICLALPLRLFGGLIPTPILPLVVVYFWTIYEPDRLPSSLVFVLGLLQDALTGSPFGLWSMVYLIVQLVVLSQRSYFLGRDLQVVWLGFSVIAIGAGMTIWLVLSLMSGGFLPLLSVLLQILVTIAVYPILGHGFRNIRHRVLLEV